LQISYSRNKCVLAKSTYTNNNRKHCVTKLQKYYKEWRDLQKLLYRKTETQLKKKEQFISILNDLFDITQADTHNIMKIEGDRALFISQRQKDRPGSLLGVDLKMIKKEERAIERRESIEERRKRTYREMKIASKWHYFIKYITYFIDV